MASNTTAKGDIVKGYCEQYKHLGDLPLARLIHAEDQKQQVKHFRSVEHARCVVRYYRGHMGKKLRSDAIKEHMKPLTHDTRNCPAYKEAVNTSAKILILDIETAPLSVFVWGYGIRT